MICIKCNKEFIPKKSSCKYCSKKCRDQQQSLNSYYKNRQKRLDYCKRPECRARQKKLEQTQAYKDVRNANLKKKRKLDIIFRLKHSILDRERRFRKTNASKLEDYLGYKLQDLIDKLIPKESIDKYMKREFELDHIIPYGNFIILEAGDQEFKKCWNLRNLRLIPATENRKRNKLNYFKDVINNKIEDLLPLGPKELWETIKQSI